MNKILYLLLACLVCVVGALTIYSKHLQRTIDTYTNQINELEIQLNKSNKTIELYDKLYIREKEIINSYDDTTQSVNELYRNDEGVKSWCDVALPYELQCLLND